MNTKLDNSNFLKDFSTYENVIRKASRDKIFKLMGEIRKIEIPNLNKLEVRNLIKFLNIVREDERYSYLLSLYGYCNTRFKNNGGYNNPNIFSILGAFPKLKKSLEDHYNSQRG